jgi:hypothetical protein
MDTQSELTVKISDAEIFFNCKNYDKEFIVELGKVILNILPDDRPLKPQDVLNAIRNFLNSGDNGNTDKTGLEIIDDEKLKSIGNAGDKSQDDKKLKSTTTKTANTIKPADNHKTAEARRNPGKFKDKREEIIFDIKSGLGLAECQKRYGMSKNTYFNYKKIALESQSNSKKPNRPNRSKNLGASGKPMTPEERVAWLKIKSI